MNIDKTTNQLLKEERIAYRQALIRRNQELKKQKLAQKQALIKKNQLLKEKRLAQKQALREKNQLLKEEKADYDRIPLERNRFLKEEKRALKRSIEQEKRFVKDRHDGKSYVLNDFDLHFKRSPKYQKEFREVEAKYVYRNQVVTYYLFVRKDLDNQEALESAKNQIKNLIATGEMRKYAKYYCRSVY